MSDKDIMSAQDVRDSLASIVDTDFFCGKRILILGATGLIGTMLVRSLIGLFESGNGPAELVIAGRDKERLDSRFPFRPWIKRYVLDINDKLPEMGNFDIILNAASPADPISFSERPVQVMITNFSGTNNVLYYAVTHSNPIVLQISSGEIYGFFRRRKIAKEDDQGSIPILSSRSCYPIAKRAVETLCCSYIEQYKLDVRIVRPSHVFGPGFTDYDSRASADFFRSASAGKNIVLKSDGTQRRTYIYVSDCVSGILSVVSRGVPGKAYNVTNSANDISLAEFARMIANEADVKVSFENSNMATAQSNTESEIKKVAELNDSLLRSLGWKPSINLSEGIHRTLNTFNCSDKNRVF